jgi:hypothetical protein
MPKATSGSGSRKMKKSSSIADFDEEIFDNLATRLQRVDPRLTFELGSKSSQRDFIISAGGIKSSFPAVQSLANSAPQLPRWNVFF